MPRNFILKGSSFDKLNIPLILEYIELSRTIPKAGTYEGICILVDVEEGRAFVRVDDLTNTRDDGSPLSDLFSNKFNGVKAFFLGQTKSPILIDQPTDPIDHRSKTVVRMPIRS